MIHCVTCETNECPLPQNFRGLWLESPHVVVFFPYQFWVFTDRITFKDTYNTVSTILLSDTQFESIEAFVTFVKACLCDSGGGSGSACKRVTDCGAEFTFAIHDENAIFLGTQELKVNFNINLFDLMPFSHGFLKVTGAVDIFEDTPMFFKLEAGFFRGLLEFFSYTHSTTTGATVWTLNLVKLVAASRKLHSGLEWYETDFTGNNAATATGAQETYCPPFIVQNIGSGTSYEINVDGSIKLKNGTNITEPNRVARVVAGFGDTAVNSVKGDFSQKCEIVAIVEIEHSPTELFNVGFQVGLSASSNDNIWNNDMIVGLRVINVGGDFIVVGRIGATTSMGGSFSATGKIKALIKCRYLDNLTRFIIFDEDGNLLAEAVLNIAPASPVNSRFDLQVLGSGGGADNEIDVYYVGFGDLAGGTHALMQNVTLPIRKISAQVIISGTNLQDVECEDIGFNLGCSEAPFPDFNTSELILAAGSIVSDQLTTLLVTLQVKDQYGNNWTTGGDVVTFGTVNALGSFGSVTDNMDGTYEAEFTPALGVDGADIIFATLNGDQVTDTEPLTVVGIDADNCIITSDEAILPADGASTALITVQLFDSANNPWTVGGATVLLFATSGSFGSVTDNGDGTYEAIYTAGTTVGTVTITGTVNGDAIADDAEIDLIPEQFITYGGSLSSGVRVQQLDLALAPQWDYSDANVNNRVLYVHTNDSVYYGRGNFLRRLLANGTQDWINNMGSNVNAVSQDSSGNILAANNTQIRIINAATGGTINSFFITGIGITLGIVVDSAGNIYTTGEVSSSNTTRKYDSGGTLIWSYNHGAQTNSIALDSNGDVIIGGNTVSGVAVRRLNGSTGALIQSFADHGGNILSVAVGSDDNVIAVGNNGAGNFQIRKYRSSDGAILWSQAVGTSIKQDVCIDFDDNIYVVGDRVSNLTLWKLDYSNGNIVDDFDHGANSLSIDITKV